MPIIQDVEETLLLCESTVARLTEEINQLRREKCRLEWISVGQKSYPDLKRRLFITCLILRLFDVLHKIRSSWCPCTDDIFYCSPCAVILSDADDAHITDDDK